MLEVRVQIPGQDDTILQVPPDHIPTLLYILKSVTITEEV